MTESAPLQDWWTVEELVAAGLPDLPATARALNAMARRDGWREGSLSRRRRGARGGGWEYHRDLLPTRAQARIAAAAVTCASGAPAPGRDRSALWAAFEAAPQTVRDAAQYRLDILMLVNALEESGSSATAAVRAVAAQSANVSERSIWAWRDLVRAIRRDDWAPALAPRHRTARRKVRKAQVPEQAWEIFAADYLRLEAPPLADCYRRLSRVAEGRGWDLPSQKTLQRMMDRRVSRPMQVLARQGERALAQLYPAQTRDKRALAALEMVNADYHRFDVFVEWDGEIVRPQMVAFQDVYSGKMLSYRFERTACWAGVQLAFGDMVEEYGIPAHVLLDNGREFASKQFTAGVQHRFRWKHRDDDVPGILTSLGIEVHFSTPYSGQSKPIERAFRDMCSAISRDPRLAGAWTGNAADAKPENYASRAVPIDRFVEIVSEGIAEHNAREGRRSPICAGRSFDQTFAESYETAPIRKATEQQRRLWLMGAEGLVASKSSGELRFMGGRYWSPWMSDIAGERVVARFDPAALDAGLYVYDFDGRFHGEAQCVEPGQFLSLEDARAHSKARAAYRKRVKEMLEAERKLRPEDAAEAYDAASASPAETPVARVVRPVFGEPVQRPVLEPADGAAASSLVSDIAGRLAERRAAEARASADGPDDRFARALQIEAALAAGEPVTPEDALWVASYSQEPEYRARQRLRRVALERDSAG